MRVDHVSFAAERDGLAATAARLSEKLGVEAVDGGIHARFGTRAMILPLSHERYVEVVEVLDHPSAEKAPFGKAVRARSEAGGGWIFWVVRLQNPSEMQAVEEHLGRQAVEGVRRMPDGRVFSWQQIGILGTLTDPQLPYFIHWDPSSPHPSMDANTEVTIDSLNLAGEESRVRDWLGRAATDTSSVISFNFMAPHGTPGLLSVVFNTPNGPVTI
ncbi:VOC family protein [Kribbia dieselivorans]|uniref:VOC family protein n=1 Tax=Kribbia dieselivorans TaxID=331526 RepID=UPI000837C347|nr:VOC family protein [Kribbia dieselivorans]